MLRCKHSLIWTFTLCLGCRAEPPASSALEVGLAAPVSSEARPAPAPPDTWAGPALDVSDLPGPVEVRAAWVVTAAPTELDIVEAALFLLVGNDPEPRRLEVGRFWRDQEAVLDIIYPEETGDALFVTSAKLEEGVKERPVMFRVRRAQDDIIVESKSGAVATWRKRAQVKLGTGAAVRAIAPGVAR